MPLQKVQTKVEQPKQKPRGRKRKLKKTKLTARDTSIPDLSSLRKPIDTSVSALYQISKLLEDGTDEVKSILSYECDVIYECRICRSLFRSIINLISHKREYCREKFNITLHRNMLDLNAISANASIIHMCETEQVIIEDNVKNDRILRSQVSKEARKKDLTSIVDTLCKKQKENVERNPSSQSEVKIITSDAASNQHIYLEPIGTNNSAVYQTIKSSDEAIDTTDLMKEQIDELQNMMDQCIILGDTSRHTYKNEIQEKSDDPIGVDINDEENKLLIDRLSTINNLVCPICNAKFFTKKTLTCHMKTLHTSQRTCYLCPCCTRTFMNTWSVYRHLFKVHKKSNEQVRKLRSQIQKKPFHELRELCAARAFTTENTVTNGDKAQKWMCQNHLKSDRERHSCIRCGKKFKKKATLSAHSQYCQASVVACNEFAVENGQPDRALAESPFDNILCEIEDNNAVTDTIADLSVANKNTSDTNFEHMSSSFKTVDKQCETSICVRAISNLSQGDWDMLKIHNYLPECNSIDNNNDFNLIVPPITQNIDDSESPISSDTSQDCSESKNSCSPEIMCTSTSEISFMAPKSGGERKVQSQHDEQRLIDLKEENVNGTSNSSKEDNFKAQPSCSIYPNKMKWTLLMENKIASIANLHKLQCLLCKQKFTSMINLRRHLANHIGWYRYRCKLCNFKCFIKCDCIAHCIKMHNMQNDRATLTDMIIEIPEDMYACNEDIVDITSADSKIVMNVTASPSRSEVHEESSNSSYTNTRVISHDEAIIASEQVTESHGDAERENVDEESSVEATTVQELTEYIMNCGSENLDTYPDLKRIVMEVILGSSDASLVRQTNKCALDTDNGAGRNMDANDVKNNTATIHMSERKSCMISNGLKSQRPARNRAKPLNKDFVYDLKEVTRKDDILYKQPSISLDKSLATSNHLHLCNSESLKARKKAKIYN